MKMIVITIRIIIIIIVVVDDDDERTKKQTEKNMITTIAWLSPSVSGTHR